MYFFWIHSNFLILSVYSESFKISYFSLVLLIHSVSGRRIFYTKPFLYWNCIGFYGWYHLIRKYRSGWLTVVYWNSSSFSTFHPRLQMTSSVANKSRETSFSATQLQSSRRTKVHDRTLALFKSQNHTMQSKQNSCAISEQGNSHSPRNEVNSWAIYNTVIHQERLHNRTIVEALQHLK